MKLPDETQKFAFLSIQEEWPSANQINKMQHFCVWIKMQLKQDFSFKTVPFKYVPSDSKIQHNLDRLYNSFLRRLDYNMELNVNNLIFY